MAYIMGTEEPETLTGFENEDDALLGFAGDDHLIGLGGNDQLFGHGGADLLEGGAGDDIYQLFDELDGMVDTVIDSSGWDKVRTDVGRDLEDYPDIEAIEQLDSYGGRSIYGNALDNEILDADGGNILDGREGNDVIRAGGGNDVLFGGLGIDGLVGGLGSDRFDFRSVEEIGLGESTRDVIYGFAPGVDRIGLGLVDANEIRTGNQAFSFLGSDEFTGQAGELRWTAATRGSTAITLVEGDTDGDGVADFQIELSGTVALTAGDFIL